MPTLATKEQYNEYFRNYYAENIKKLREYKREYNKKWRQLNGYHNESNWQSKNSYKVKAQKKLQQAVKDKKVMKRACLYCNSTKTVAHHPNYNLPLQVIWVCHIHHRGIHYTTKR